MHKTSHEEGDQHYIEWTTEGSKCSPDLLNCMYLIHTRYQDLISSMLVSWVTTNRQ